jgi:hypothetical protein
MVELDSAAVAALGALLTVLVFLNGFVSVRLHAFHDRTLERLRALDESTSGRTLPHARLAEQARRLGDELLPPLSREALGASVLIFATFLLLSLLTVADAERAVQEWAVWLMVFAAALVTAVTLRDYQGLTRDLRARLDALPISVLGDAERRMCRAERVADADTARAQMQSVASDITDLLRRPGLDDWPRGLGCRGVARLLAGDPGAHRDLTLAAAGEPDEPRWRWALARLHEDVGDPAAAARWAADAARLDYTGERLAPARANRFAYPQPQRADTYLTALDTLVPEDTSPYLASGLLADDLVRAARGSASERAGDRSDAYAAGLQGLVDALLAAGLGWWTAREHVKQWLALIEAGGGPLHGRLAAMEAELTPPGDGDSDT